LRREEPPSAVVTAWVERHLTRRNPAWLRKDGRCLHCYLTVTTCSCGTLPAAANKHTVTVLLHPQEVGRLTSTSGVLRLGLRRCHVRVWNSAATPTVAAAWEEIQAQCAASGQTPAFLFPAPHAVPVGQLWSALPPAKRAAGLHVCVLDGTWSNARAMARYLPPDAHCVVIAPPAVFTLFSPLRTQPAPGKVSTLEAVAVMFDELQEAAAACPGAPHVGSGPTAVPGAATAAAGGAGGSASAPADASGAASAPAATSPPATAPAAAAVNVKDFLVASARAAVTIAPAYRSVSGVATLLRRRLMMLVDALCRQTNKLGMDVLGPGYRTWYLGRNAGALARVPAHVVTLIARFAYGLDRVLEDGYRVRVAAGNAAWTAALGDSKLAVRTARNYDAVMTAKAGAGGSGSLAAGGDDVAPAARAGGVGGEASAAAPAGVRVDVTHAHGGQHGPTTVAASTSAHAAPAAAPRADGSAIGADESPRTAGDACAPPDAAPHAEAGDGGGGDGDGDAAAVARREKNVRRKQARALWKRVVRPANAATATPLALCCFDLHTLAAGWMSGTWRPAGAVSVDIVGAPAP
jgi:DTW domain-containing protein YfiP